MSDIDCVFPNSSPQRPGSGTHTSTHMFGEYSDYVFKVLIIVGPIVLVLLVMVADRRRDARRLLASGSPLATPPSGPGAIEGLAAFLVSLIGLPLLGIGAYNLITEFREVRALEKKTMLVSSVSSQHLESDEFGNRFLLLVELTGEVDRATRHVQASYRSLVPLLPKKSEFDALDGQAVELWLLPDSSEFRMSNAFRWKGIGIGLLGIAFLIVPGLTFAYVGRSYRRRAGRTVDPKELTTKNTTST